jgi:hypothetical protein
MIIDIEYDKVYEGSYWHVGVVFSNRFGTRIEWTCSASGSAYVVPATMVNDVLENLQSGKTPEEVAKTLPIG